MYTKNLLHQLFFDSFRLKFGRIVFMNDLIKHKLELLPDSPGCYLHKNKDGKIIYVGKAKNLKNRVRSYFRGSHDTKTELLVSEIADFEFIVTGSNTEALLLEINLIQENMPRYNIKLKDDKSYPFIKITNEHFPRLLITRQIRKNDGLYFGPYPDSYTANEVKKLLDRIFPFKKCTNPVNKVCFYYHIGQCNAHTICQTDNAGADAILECVGTEQSVDTAVKVARPGAVIGRVGIPQNPNMNTNELFWKNIGLRGGIASVTTFDKEVLLDAVLTDKINPGKVFTKSFALDDIQAAYEAMDKRKAINSPRLSIAPFVFFKSFSSKSNFC